MRKQVAKNKRTLARKVANMDGKYKGLTQSQVEKALSFLELIDMATTELGYKSPIVMLRKKSKKKLNKAKKGK